MSDRVFLDKPGADQCIADLTTYIGNLAEVAQNIDKTMTQLTPGCWDGNKAQETKAEY